MRLTRYFQTGDFQPCDQEDFAPIAGELGLFENESTDANRTLVNR